MNIGLAFLKAFKASLDFEKNILILGKSIIRMQKPRESPSFSNPEHLDSINTNQGKTEEIRAYSKDTVAIPPHSLASIRLKTHSKENRLASDDEVEILTDRTFVKPLFVLAGLVDMRNCFTVLSQYKELERRAKPTVQ